MSSTFSKRSRATNSRPPKTNSTSSPSDFAELGPITTNERVVDGEVFVTGSGNVFADLGLPNPEERLLKAQLMHAINAEIGRRNLTQEAAGEFVGLAQSDLSRIKSGRGSGFSTERLIDVLRYLGRDVEIVVSPTTKTIGELRFRELAV